MSNVITWCKCDVSEGDNPECDRHRRDRRIDDQVLILAAICEVKAELKGMVSRGETIPMNRLINLASLYDSLNVEQIKGAIESKGLRRRIA